jgi:DNA-binding MarR family transcriptional regulator
MPNQKDPRMTFTTAKVLQVFLQEPTQSVAGSDIAAQTHLPSGTLYPILLRLEAVGWLESEWENVNPAKEGRPRKRLYRITRTGLDRASTEFTALAEALRI